MQQKGRMQLLGYAFFVYIEIVAFYKYIASCHFFTGSCGSRFCFISIITNGKSETPYQKQTKKTNKTKQKNQQHKIFIFMMIFLNLVSVPLLLVLVLNSMNSINQENLHYLNKDVLHSTFEFYFCISGRVLDPCLGL